MDSCTHSALRRGCRLDQPGRFARDAGALMSRTMPHKTVAVKEKPTMMAFRSFSLDSPPCQA